jgi:uncharacterized membrane protein YdjX (TVP38/TMEM64 family)
MLIVTGAWIFIALSMGGWFDGMSAEAFKDLVVSWGVWGVFASILLMVLHSFVPFPAEFVAIANGMCFGPVLGTAITWVGAMLGAVLAFALSRRFGRPLVERIVSRNSWNRLDDWLARYGGDGAFLCRFIPVNGGAKSVQKAE